MLSLAPGYVRLDIPREADFSEVSESIRALLQVCRLNRLRAALVVSRQDPFDWRSCLRVALRFAASRDAGRGLRLALVADHFDEAAREDVLAVARETGQACGIFRREEEALAWLRG